MGAGLGKHRYREIDRWYEAINRFLSGPRMVVAGRLDGVRYRFANHIIQADLFANGKDLVNACDLVISKPGMGILTDCISLRKPLLFFPPDDMERLQKVEMLQQLMGEDALVIGDERDLAAKVRWAMRMKERYRERFSRVPVNGAEVTARICSKIQHMDRATLKRHYKDLRLLTPFGA